MTEQQTKFLALIDGPAKESERRWDIPAPITIAQAILESGWGQSQLFLQANNPFGMKTLQHRRDGEPYCEFDTRECVNGEWEVIRAQFLRFGSLTDAFNKHGSMFWSERYGPVIDACKTISTPYTLEQLRTIALAIQHCGYSTDPNYSDKILQLIQQIQAAPEPQNT